MVSSYVLLYFTNTGRDSRVYLQLAQQFAAGASISLTFPQSGGSVEFPLPSGGLISEFTTYGPSKSLSIASALSVFTASLGI